MEKKEQSLDDVAPITPGNSGGLAFPCEVVGSWKLQVHDEGVLWDGRLIRFRELADLRARAAADLRELGIYVGE